MVVQRPTGIASLSKTTSKGKNGQAAEQENSTNNMNSDSSASEMATSFLGSLILPPRFSLASGGGKMRDSGNEVGEMDEDSDETYDSTSLSKSKNNGLTNSKRVG